MGPQRRARHVRQAHEQRTVLVVALDLGSRPLILLGAGASVEAGVPATVEITQKVVSEIGQSRFSPYAQALNFVSGALVAYDSAEGKSPYEGLDIERVFAAVELLAERSKLEVTPFVASWHPAVDAWDRKRAPGNFDNQLQKEMIREHGRPKQVIERLIESMTGPGTGEVYEYLTKEMILHLRRLIAPPYTDLSYLAPLVKAASATSGLTIATLNYDVAIELTCKDTGVAVDTGIEHWIESGRWRWSDRGVRLLKLHGSIDWYWEWNRGENDELPLRVVAKSSEPESDEGEPVLAFGSRNKLKPEGPFLSLLSEFEDKLADSDHLIVVGYSFRDDHINEVIVRWTREDKERRISLIDPSPGDAPRSRGFREKMVWTLNRGAEHEGSEQLKRVDVRSETAAEAFAQMPSD
jgi:hypothetical protein